MPDEVRFKPILVGESNPFGSDPYFALYPAPEGSAGWRLAQEIFRFQFRKTYLESFERMNLIQLPPNANWSAPAAREAAARLEPLWVGRRVVLLGTRVCAAFGFPNVPPFTSKRRYEVDYFFLPHPSGRNRIWNDPASIEKARAMLPQILGQAVS